MKKIKNLKNILIGVAIIIGLIGIDQLSKLLAVVNLKDNNSIKIIGDFFKLTYAENFGAAWSSFSGETTFLVIVSLLALGLFVFMFRKVNFKNKKVYSIALSMMIGGLFGNFIDRLFTDGNYVVDFLDFNIFGYEFPIFNIADMCLSFGVALFIIDLLFLEGKRSEKNKR